MDGSSSDGSAFSEDASASDSGGSGDEDEESGADWSDMEAKVCVSALIALSDRLLTRLGWINSSSEVVMILMTIAVKSQRERLLHRRTRQKLDVAEYNQELHLIFVCKIHCLSPWDSSLVANFSETCSTRPDPTLPFASSLRSIRLARVCRSLASESEFLLMILYLWR